MFSLSIPAGRWLGVPVRIHLSLLLLLALSAGYSAVQTGSFVRGVVLWLALCAALVVREGARSVAAAHAGSPARALFLLPTGGVLALAPRSSGRPSGPVNTRSITYIGSAANFLAALALAGFACGIDPRVKLLAQPWIATSHLLRSAVWLQVLIGIVNLIPSSALLSRRLTRSKPVVASVEDAAPAPARRRPAFGLSTALALGLMLLAVVYGMLWPFLLGLTVLFSTYLHRVAGSSTADAMAVSVSDVMLTEFLALNASTTLRDALRQTTHSLHDRYPVLRGERLVGWISRTLLSTKLQLEGDGFLQGSMLRSLQTASPEESLGEALRRATAMGAGEFIPVVRDGAVVGVLTPNSVERALSQLRLTRDPGAGRAE